MLDIYIREFEKEDHNFVMNSWLKSFEKTIKLMGTDTQIYRREQMRLMGGIIEKAKVYVACPEDAQQQIYGYIVWDAIGDVGILHYVYVKNPYRRFGIGRKLYDCIERSTEIPCLATHKTLAFDYLKSWNLAFNPYFLLKGDYYE
jgi:hypothetical protein